MKSIFSILLLSVFSFAAIGQTNSTGNPAPKKNELLEMGVKGNVKSIKTTSFRAVKKSGVVVEEKKGKMQNRFWEKDDIIHFDAQGNRTERVEFLSDGTTYRKNSFKHDANGYTTEEATYLPDGSAVRKSNFIYTFDSQGRLIERDRFVNDTVFTAKYIIKYDSAGNKKEWIDQDAAGKTVSITTYDSKGNIADWTSFKSDGSIQFKLVYKYDEKGNNIEQTQYKNGTKFFLKYTYKYDDKGNPIELAWLNEKGKVTNLFTMTYEYDSTGNWIKQTEFHNGKPMSIYERAIEYEDGK